MPKRRDGVAASVEVVLRSRLLSSPSLVALVDDRIMPTGQAHDEGFNRFPMVTYQRVSTTKYPEHSGPAGMASGRVQFSCWAKSWSQAREVADEVQRALDGWIDYNATPRIGAVLVGNELDNYETDTKTHHVVMDVTVHYSL